MKLRSDVMPLIRSSWHYAIWGQTSWPHKGHAMSYTWVVLYTLDGKYNYITITVKISWNINGNKSTDFYTSCANTQIVKWRHSCFNMFKAKSLIHQNFVQTSAVHEMLYLSATFQDKILIKCDSTSIMYDPSVHRHCWCRLDNSKRVQINA